MFAAVGLYFGLDIYVPGLVLASLVSAISSLVSGVVFGMCYLFAVERATIWLDLLIVVLVTLALLILVARGGLLLGE